MLSYHFPNPNPFADFCEFTVKQHFPLRSDWLDILLSPYDNGHETFTLLRLTRNDTDHPAARERMIAVAAYDVAWCLRSLGIEADYQSVDLDFTPAGNQAPTHEGIDIESAAYDRLTKLYFEYVDNELV